MSLKETVIKLMCIAALLGCFIQTAAADWYDDLKPNGTWVEIEGEDFVAETFYGVPALYNEDDRYYQCNEVIMRFYREAYGLSIRAHNENDPICLTDGYKFEQTKSPKPGDIIFVSAEMRDSDMNHWAIVRSYEDGYITMFEQNARYNGQAAVGRRIKFPSDSYYIYTPVSTGDAPAPVLKNAVTGEKDKTTTTQVSTTQKETTTQKPTTTAPTTTAPTTTKPTTTAATTTGHTTMPSVTVTEAVSETLTAVSETVTEEVTTAVAVTVSQTVTLTQAAEETKADNGKSGYLMYAVAGSALAVVLSAIVIAKKRKNS